MCQCIKKLEERVVKEQPFENLKITEAKITSAALFFDGGTKMIGEMEVTVEGRKRPLKKNIVYSHCPLCGEKYPGGD